MSNVKEIGDGALNGLYERITSTLIDLRVYDVKQGPLYRGVLSSKDSLKHTYTLAYINNVLTSGLAKLYMIMGHTKGEIDRSELKTNLDDIINDMTVKDRGSMYFRHSRLSSLITEAEDINTRIDHISIKGL